MSNYAIGLHSARSRKILIADDEEISRNILGNLLESDYELVYAENGQQAWEILEQQGQTLSLVMLDQYMPGMTGMDLLKKAKMDENLKAIPVIMMTADERSEVESLEAGASDFFSKPYPHPDVILARVRRAIELYEDRQILSSTERDTLTGLYNWEFFCSYVSQYDRYYPDLVMDAAVVDISHFHMFNERYGTSSGNLILSRMAKKIRQAISGKGGIVCRRSADVFYLYLPQGTDYAELRKSLMNLTEPGDDFNGKVHVRMGVYPAVDKELDIGRRFDRAKSASDRVRSIYSEPLGIYDDQLRQHELYEEQLVEDFQRALDEKQFVLYFQPKYDVTQSTPQFAGAEALVRWIHPDRGFLPPGDFIPLFESNGLIRNLDEYVWEQAAASIRRWKEHYHLPLAVSVNVSRMDFYDANLVDTFADLIRRYGLEPGELHLEVTESAYEQDSEQMIRTITRLRELGFLIEMDDFGQGYSSLHMISSLPIDVLKLDMRFVREAFGQTKNTRMIEIVLDISDYLGVPVVAEGVENEEQYRELKRLGCDMIQGYYFSKPLPPADFEELLKKQQAGILSGHGLSVDFEHRKVLKQMRRVTYSNIAQALAMDYALIFYVDLEQDTYIEYSTGDGHDEFSVTRWGKDFFGVCMTWVERVVHPQDSAKFRETFSRDRLLGELAHERSVSLTYRTMMQGEVGYVRLKATRLSKTDDRHIIFGMRYVDAEVQRANQAISFENLAKAFASDYYSIFYVDEETGEFLEYSAGRNAGELKIERQGGDFFTFMRQELKENVYSEDQDLVMSSFTRENLTQVLDQSEKFTMNYRRVLDHQPSYVHLKAIRMQGGETPHIVIGISDIDSQIRREMDYMKALRDANRDALTGVRNKRAFLEQIRQLNGLIRSGDVEEFAVAMCDVNHLKEVNDLKGHKFGDDLLKNACKQICDIFKHSPVFRIGGDEFVAVLVGSDYAERDALMKRMESCNKEAAEQGGVVVACGISDYKSGTDDSVEQVLERADSAMYANKEYLKQSDSRRENG